MKRFIIAALSLTLCAGLAGAQKPTKATATSKAVATASSSSKNAKTVTKTFRRVIKNGKVVLEEGDRKLLKHPGVPDLEKLVKEALAEARASGTKSGKHRVVVKNAKTLRGGKPESGSASDSKESKAAQALAEKMRAKLKTLGKKILGDKNSPTPAKKSKKSSATPLKKL